jgi:tRNA threonylcarbamoyladenosine biosynthesis protein TsaB
MKVLGIDASKPLGSVGLIDGEQVLGEHKFPIVGNHKSTLLGKIDRLLKETGVSIEEIQGVSVVIGPGSFTGLRVALATAKGLCMLRELPLAGVSSLEALAWLLPYCRLPILAAIDARRGEVYVGLYNTESGNPVRLGEEVSLSPEKMFERFEGEVVIIGDGAETYGDKFEELYGDKAHVVRTFSSFPGGALVALLGREKILKGELLSLEQSVPVYIRPAAAIFKKRP